MLHSARFVKSLLWPAILLAMPALALVAVAAPYIQPTTNEISPGIVLHCETRTNPPEHLFVAVVDLKNPKLHVRVAPAGPDPDGPGKWETTLLEPTKIAGRENFDLVVNGDFFAVKGINDGEGINSHYHTGQWAYPVSPAMTDGRTWSTCAKAAPCLVVHKNGTVTIELLTQPNADDWEVVGGGPMLVQNGVVVPGNQDVSLSRYPRTAVGLDVTGAKLIILVVDGRKPGIAVGMNGKELADEMVSLGCAQAMNLDGGGSSVMAVRDTATGKMKILNQPTDGHERAVADVLGIAVEK
jgi:exopolysaccharide biosynthesis protein